MVAAVIAGTIAIIGIYLILTGGKGAQGSGDAAKNVINAIGDVFTKSVGVLMVTDKP